MIPSNHIAYLAAPVLRGVCAFKVSGIGVRAVYCHWAEAWGGPDAAAMQDHPRLTLRPRLRASNSRFHIDTDGTQGGSLFVMDRASELPDVMPFCRSGVLRLTSPQQERVNKAHRHVLGLPERARARGLCCTATGMAGWGRRGHAPRANERRRVFGWSCMGTQRAKKVKQYINSVGAPRVKVYLASLMRLVPLGHSADAMFRCAAPSRQGSRRHCQVSCGRWRATSAPPPTNWT